VVLRPGETPALSDPRVYLEAAADFERDASAEDARAVFDAAVRRWPQESVAWVGRGTAEYKRGNLREAARDYHRALELDATQIGARNNLAQALLDLRCPRLARIHLAPFDAAIDPASLRSPLREAVEDTLRQVREAAERAPDAAECSDIL
jgi:tetratricopeptide (TPR) repeat protein